LIRFDPLAFRKEKESWSKSTPGLNTSPAIHVPSVDTPHSQLNNMGIKNTLLS
jgi:hypothetical protein